MAGKLAFFDIDGTLCVPRYKDKHGNFVIGFSDEDWFEFCEKAGEDGYADALVVQPVKRYAESLKEAGVRIFVLSTAQSPGEIAAKEKQMGIFFPGLFEKVITVGHDPEKLSVIKEYASKYDCELPDCELVEDTYSTILKANEIGIKATHISMLVYDL